jgi:hypothetical protein
MRRSSRSDALVDRPRLLSALGDCRKTLTGEMSRMTVNGPLCYSASTVLAAIDGLALMLTGRREYFWEQGSRPTADENERED